MQRVGDNYRPDVDGLRAIAVTAVVLYHTGLGIVPGGFVGVDIFFVISGYLIGGIILREIRQSHFTFAAFYARRARRILPALIVVVLFTCALGWILLNSEELKNLGSSAAAAIGAFSNFKFWLRAGYFDPDARLDPMLMTWSLGVEEQFYLLFPFLLIVVSRFAKNRIFGALAGVSLLSLAASLVMLRLDPRGAFYLLPARAWELGAGALVVTIHQRYGASATPLRANLQAVAGMLLLAVGVEALNDATPFPGFAALAPVLGTLLLIDAPQSWIAKRILASAPMVFIGLISYSWYLWHWPLMTYVRVAANAAPRLALTAAALLALALAIITWRFIEQPFRKRALRPATVLTRYAAVLAMAACVPLALHLGDGFAQRLPARVREVEQVIAQGRGQCLAPFGAAAPPTDGVCSVNREGAAAAIMGDSHAAALEPALTEWSAAHGLILLHFTRSACPALQGVSLDMQSEPANWRECASFQRAAQQDILANRNISTVFIAGLWAMGGWTERSRLVDENGRPLANANGLRVGMAPLLAALVQAGKRVVVFGDVPNLDFNAARTATTKALPARNALARLTNGDDRLDDGVAPMALVSQSAIATNAIIRQIVEATPGVTYVDPTAAFCGEAGCRFEDQNGRLLYFDEGHVTLTGARMVVRGMRSFF